MNDKKILSDTEIQELVNNPCEWRKHIFKQIDKIERHLEKQNGKVGSLEVSRGRMWGMISAVTFFLAPIYGAVIYIVIHLMRLP